MSVQKRKQVKALESLAAKLPLTNLAGALAIGVCAKQSFALGDGVMAWLYGGVGAVVGLLVYGTFQKRIQQAENRWRAKVRELSAKMESKLDEEQGTQNKLLDSYELQYLGGHPGWLLSGKSEFGTLDIYDKTLVFKNKANRVKLQMARIKRVSAETDKVMRLKKLSDVVLPRPPVVKNPLLARLMAEVRKRQRYLVIDYLDDLGQKRLIVLSAVGGNPLKAKAVKEAIEGPLKKIPKEKRVQGSAGGSSGQTSGFQQATDAQIAAAEAASRRSYEPAAPVASDEVRFQVVLEGAGKGPDEQEAIAQQMASLFSIPPDRAVAALARIPFVAKRNVSEEQAEKLVSALTAIGASARAEAMRPLPHS